MKDGRARRIPKNEIYGCMDNIRTWTGLGIGALLRLVENRQGWRNVVRNASNLRIIEEGSEQNRTILNVAIVVVNLYDASS